MTQRKKPQTQSTRQGQNFIETARELGADEDEGAFKRKLEKIAKAKSAPPKESPKG
jgi:hypothetical protein